MDTAFVGTNATGNPITSGLPVTRSARQILKMCIVVFGEFVLAYVITGRCFSMCAVIDRNAYIGCENKKWSAFARRSDHHISE